MFKRKIKLSLLCLAFFVVSCQSSSKQPNTQMKIVKINLRNEPCSLDPRQVRDLSGQALMRMLFEGLTRIGPDDQPQLALAQSVEISEDLKSYQFTLKKSRWSNGQPVTAGDFIYSWQSSLDPASSVDYAFDLYILKNAKAIKDGKLPMEELGVTAMDDQTLLIELEYPTPYFLELLAFPIFFPVNEGIDREDPNWFYNSQTYVSNGPFSLSSWRHHDLLVSEKNHFYWDAAHVELDGIEMTMVSDDTELKLFEKNQLHWAGSPLSSVPVDALSHLKRKNQLNIQGISGTAFIRVNTELAPLQNPKVRRALALAINRQALVTHVMQGEQIPAMELLPPCLKLQEEGYFADGNTEESKELFAKGLKEMKITREAFPTITFTYGANERNHMIAQAIQQQWHETLGIRVNLEAVERKVYFDRVSKQDYQLAYGDWLADFNDPINFLEVFKYKKQSTNNTNWENPIYARLLDRSYGVVEGAERDELLKKCEGILMDAMPIIPIYHHSMLYLKDQHLDGVLITSLGHLDFRWAHFDGEK